jgi:hypothetical protein
MPVMLPDDLLTSTNLSEAELKTEIALALFQRELLTLASDFREGGDSRGRAATRLSAPVGEP